MTAGSEAFRDNAISLPERFGHVPNLGLERLHDVVAPLLMHQRGVRGEGLFDSGHGLKRLILHVDQTRGVFCCISVGGHYNRHGLAHKTHLVLGEHGPVAGLMRGSLGRLVFDSERLNRLGNISSG